MKEGVGGVGRGRGHLCLISSIRRACRTAAKRARRTILLMVQNPEGKHTQGDTHTQGHTHIYRGTLTHTGTLTRTQGHTHAYTHGQPAMSHGRQVLQWPAVHSVCLCVCACVLPWVTTQPPPQLPPQRVVAHMHMPSRSHWQLFHSHWNPFCSVVVVAAACCCLLHAVCCVLACHGRQPRNAKSALCVCASVCV